MLKWLLDRAKNVDLAPERGYVAIEERLHRLEIKYLQLMELHEQLQGNHDKLRSKIWGYIGADKQHEPRTAREGRTADFITPTESHAAMLSRRASARSS